LLLRSRLTKHVAARRLTPSQGLRKINVCIVGRSLLGDTQQVMANHFSALKRTRQTAKRTVRNRINRSRIRTALRHFRDALAKGDKPAAQQMFRETVSAIDKAIQKGVLHANAAARYKSRLGARLSALK
jgi:small subunit ribosomal protein S20